MCGNSLEARDGKYKILSEGSTDFYNVTFMFYLN